MGMERPGEFATIVSGVDETELHQTREQNMSVLATLLLGVAGSVIGGLVANALGTGDIFELNIIGAIAAFLSAAALIVVVEKSGVADGSKT